MPELLTLAEAAVMRKVPPSTLYQALVRGELEGVRIGERWFLDRESFDGYRVKRPGPLAAK